MQDSSPTYIRISLRTLQPNYFNVGIYAPSITGPESTRTHKRRGACTQTHTNTPTAPHTHITFVTWPLCKSKSNHSETFQNMHKFRVHWFVQKHRVLEVKNKNIFENILKQHLQITRKNISIIINFLNLIQFVLGCWYWVFICIKNKQKVAKMVRKCIVGARNCQEGHGHIGRC